MQLPVNLQVPMGTILDLSAEMDIENELTLVTMAATLSLISEQAAYLPDEALVEVTHYAFEAYSSSPEEIVNLLGELIERSEIVDFGALRSPEESDDPVSVPFKTEVPLEVVLERSDWDSSGGVQETLKAVALHELTMGFAAFVPLEFFVKSVHRGFLARYGSDAQAYFETEFLGPLKERRDGAIAEIEASNEMEAA